LVKYKSVQNVFYVEITELCMLLTDISGVIVLKNVLVG